MYDRIIFKFPGSNDWITFSLLFSVLFFIETILENWTFWYPNCISLNSLVYWIWKDTRSCHFCPLACCFCPLWADNQCSKWSFVAWYYHTICMDVGILHFIPILLNHLSLPPSSKLLFSLHTISLFPPRKVKSPVRLYCFEEVTDFM